MCKLYAWHYFANYLETYKKNIHSIFLKQKIDQRPHRIFSSIFFSRVTKFKKNADRSEDIRMLLL